MEIQEVINELRKARDNSDPETAHFNADKALCQFLITLGYEDIVVEWNKVEKWYC